MREHKHNDLDFWITATIFFVLVVLGLMAWGFIGFSKRMSILEKEIVELHDMMGVIYHDCAKMENFYEECYNSTIVEKYKLIEYEDCLDINKCIINEHITERNIQTNDVVTVYRKQTDIPCTHNCKSKTPYIQYYNETICTKTILVKEAG